jgi:carboxymethylenebutenolidase
MKTDVSISMPDGDARAFVFTPNSGSGPWPATILYMDAPAIRPAMFEMGERLAQAGYYVLLPDVFWTSSRPGPATRRWARCSPGCAPRPMR